MDDGIYRVTDHDGSIELEWLRSDAADQATIDEANTVAAENRDRADRAERRLEEANARAQREFARGQQTIAPDWLRNDRKRADLADRKLHADSDARANRAEQRYEELVEALQAHGLHVAYMITSENPVVDRLVRAGKNSIRDLLAQDPPPWD